MTMSVFINVSMISKHHRIFWNLQDLFSICLERGDTPIRFAYRTAFEGFMVAEEWAKPFCAPSLEIWFIEVYLLVSLIFQRCQSQKRQQLKLMSTKSIPNYVSSQVISKFVLSIVNY